MYSKWQIPESVSAILNKVLSTQQHYQKWAMDKEKCNLMGPPIEVWELKGKPASSGHLGNCNFWV